jgi:hypothetical protein
MNKFKYKGIPFQQNLSLSSVFPYKELGQQSGWPRDSATATLALGPAQSLMQRIPAVFPRG